MNKSRLDAALVERGIVPSRAQAQRLLALGAVEVGEAGQWQVVRKPAYKVDTSHLIRVTENHALKYVSRAGLKLEKALASIHVNFSETIALDIGQSTGGFTDCLLQQGVSQVVGVDVGHGQLSPAIRNNKRVVCLEGINARSLPALKLREYAPAGFDFCVMDVSFISQTLILPGLPEVMKPSGWLVSLVKPQFEVGKEGISKGGIVKQVELYSEVQQKICDCLRENSFVVENYFESPLLGGDGNREFLVIAKLNN